MKRKLTSLLLILVMVLALLPFGTVTAHAAASGKCGDNLTWRFDDNGTLTVSGTGEMENYGMFDTQPWAEYKVKKVVIQPGVTSVGAEAFRGMKTLTSVQLPGGLKTIGYWAFKDCVKLSEVNLPEGLETIENGAFSNTGLVSVTVPASVVGFSGYSFTDCTRMMEFRFAGENEYYTSDGASLLSKDGKTLDYFVARGRTAYQIPSGVKTIKESAFWGSQNLTELTLPAGLKEIEGGAFYNCTALKSIRIPASVTSIEYNPVVGCTALESVQVEESSLTFSSDGKALFNKNKTRLCALCVASVTSYKIPYGVETVGTNAFDCHEALTQVTIPSSVTELEFDAFFDCDRLTSLTIPASVKKMGNATIVGCDMLESVTFLGYAPEMGNYRFYRGENRIKAFYPGGDDTWEQLILDYPDDRVTWVPMAGIVTQPQNVSAPVGDSAVFTVQAAGSGLTYRWQYDTGSSWKDSSLTGANTDTLSVAVTAARNGQKYRCVVEDQYGYQVISRSATLTVKIAITKQPKAASGAVGDTAKFTVKATGVGLTYQWQYKVPGSDKWVNSTAAGAKTDTLEIGVTTARNGQKYHCVVKDANGKQYTSDAARLTVKIAITQQPKAASGAVGDTAKFTVKATGAGLTYQWQYKAPGSDKWVNSTAAGAKTDTLEIGVTAARNGQKYHCVVKDANGKQYTSDAARLTVKIAITEQPQTVRAPLGETAAFHVEATGVGLTYQWQYKAPGSDKWVNSTAAGARTDTLEIGVTAARNGQKYHCVVKDANGKQYTSDAAKLLVETVITAQPQDVTAAVVETATFTVEAQGVELAYQWQYYTGSKWVNSGMTGADTAALSVPATIARNGQQYRCVITDGGGIKTESEAAVLTVK